MSSLDEFAAAKLRDLDAKNRRRSWSDSAREDGIWIERGGKRLISFSCNDYLNLSQHPAVREAAIAAIRDYGAGAGASRLVTAAPLMCAPAHMQACASASTSTRSSRPITAGMMPILAR